MHADFVSGVVAGEGVGLAVGLGDRLTVALPLVGHARIRYAIGIADGSGEFAADFALARDVHRTFVVRLRRGWAVFYIQRCTGRFFCRALVVGVFDVHADFVSGVCGGELVACPGRAADGLAVALPLVGDLRAVHAVAVADGRGERAAHFGVAGKSDCAFVVGLRLWVRRRLRIRRVVVGDGGGGVAGRRFVVLGVVVVGRLHRDFRALLRGG